MCEIGAMICRLIDEGDAAVPAVSGAVRQVDRRRQPRRSSAGVAFAYLFLESFMALIEIPDKLINQLYLLLAVAIQHKAHLRFDAEQIICRDVKNLGKCNKVLRRRHRQTHFPCVDRAARYVQPSGKLRLGELCRFPERFDDFSCHAQHLMSIISCAIRYEIIIICIVLLTSLY